MNNTELIISKMLDFFKSNPKLIGLSSDNKYFFEINRQIWDDFKSYEPNANNKQDFYDNLFSKVKKDTKLENFINSYGQNTEEYKIICITSKVMKVLDGKAPNINCGSKYDKIEINSIAHAGIRVGDWFKNLFTYKKNGNNPENLSPSIKNAIKYMESPSNNLTMLSLDHREKVNNLIFEKDFEENIFSDNIFQTLDKCGIIIANNNNKGIIYTDMLYSVRSYWDKKLDKNLLYTLIEKLKAIKINSWFYKPSDSARYWEECIDDKNIRFGFDRLMRILFRDNTFDDENILRAMKKVYPENENPHITKNTVKHLISDIRKGDLIISCKGNLYIIGLGIESKKDSTYNEVYDEYRTTQSVKWICDFKDNLMPVQSLNLSKQITQHTIQKCTNEDAIKIINYVLDNNSKSTKNINEITQNIKISLNLILYGPPGTGKTYSTKTKAVRIISRNI